MATVDRLEQRASRIVLVRRLLRCARGFESTADRRTRSDEDHPSDILVDNGNVTESLDIITSFRKHGSSATYTFPESVSKGYLFILLHMYTGM